MADNKYPKHFTVGLSTALPPAFRNGGRGVARSACPHAGLEETVKSFYRIRGQLVADTQVVIDGPWAANDVGRGGGLVRDGRGLVIPGTSLASALRTALARRPGGDALDWGSAEAASRIRVHDAPAVGRVRTMIVQRVPIDAKAMVARPAWLSTWEAVPAGTCFVLTVDVATGHSYPAKASGMLLKSLFDGLSLGTRTRAGLGSVHLVDAATLLSPPTPGLPTRRDTGHDERQPPTPTTEASHTPYPRPLPPPTPCADGGAGLKALRPLQRTLACRGGRGRTETEVGEVRPHESVACGGWSPIR